MKANVNNIFCFHAFFGRIFCARFASGPVLPCTYPSNKLYTRIMNEWYFNLDFCVFFLLVKLGNVYIQLFFHIEKKCNPGALQGLQHLLPIYFSIQQF